MRVRFPAEAGTFLFVIHDQTGSEVNPASQPTETASTLSETKDAGA
jgi:hypothetical protein